MLPRFRTDDDATAPNAILYGKMRELKHEIKDKFGIKIKVRTDFNEFRKLCNAIPDKCEVTAIFDERVSKIDHNSGLWIEGTDEHGQVVHLQAFRYDNLGDINLNAHWQENSQLYMPAGMPIDISKSVFKTAPASYEITGKVCYHAEFWVSKKRRPNGILRLLSGLGMLTAQTRFSPKFIYGFSPIKHCNRGLSVQYGYPHIHPWAPRWHITGEEHPYDEYFIWISGDELIDLWTTGERTMKPPRRADNGNDAGLPIMELKASQQPIIEQPIGV